MVACVRQWTGSSANPLSPRDTFREIAAVLASYNLAQVETDQYYVDALQDHARDAKVALIQSSLDETEKAQRYLSLRTKLAEGDLELHPDPTFLADLRRVKRKVTQRGIQIVLPVTSDGRHCDYAPSLALVATRPLHDIKDPPRRAIDPETEATRARTLGRMQERERQRALQGG